MKKEFKYLNKEELINIIYQLQVREEELIAECDKWKAIAQDRQIKIARAGSIAEASIAVSGIFEAAQRAADQYLESIRAALETAMADDPDMQNNAEVQSAVKKGAQLNGQSNKTALKDVVNSVEDEDTEKYLKSLRKEATEAGFYTEGE